MLSGGNCAPCPVDLFVWADIAVAGVVDDKQMIIPSVLNKRSHLYAQLDAGVRNRRNRPLVGVVVVSFAEDLFKGEEVMFGGCVFLPPEQQHRGGLVGGLALHLAIYVHRSILQMPGEGLEFMTLGGCGLLDGVVLTRLSRLSQLRLEAIVGWRPARREGGAGRAARDSN